MVTTITCCSIIIYRVRETVYVNAEHNKTLLSSCRSITCALLWISMEAISVRVSFLPFKNLSGLILPEVLVYRRRKAELRYDTRVTVPELVFTVSDP